MPDIGLDREISWAQMYHETAGLPHIPALFVAYLPWMDKDQSAQFTIFNSEGHADQILFVVHPAKKKAVEQIPEGMNLPKGILKEIDKVQASEIFTRWGKQERVLQAWQKLHQK